jgi:hypothetical protein
MLGWDEISNLPKNVQSTMHVISDSKIIVLFVHDDRKKDRHWLIDQLRLAMKEKEKEKKEREIKVVNTRK